MLHATDNHLISRVNAVGALTSFLLVLLYSPWLSCARSDSRNKVGVWVARSGPGLVIRCRTLGSLLTLVLRPTPHISSHITITTLNLSTEINLHGFLQKWEQQFSDMVYSASENIGESEYSIDIRHSKSLVQYWWLAGTKIIVGCAAKQDGAYYYLLDRILIQT